MSDELTAHKSDVVQCLNPPRIEWLRERIANGFETKEREGTVFGRHFDREIVILYVRWYLRYKLSFLDLVEMMAEQGLHLAHTTIMRWVQRYVPE